MAMLDGTVVNVALPRMGRDLDASLSALQWVVNAYMLTLSALLLWGGAMGDRMGRRRTLVFGVAWFAVASALCGPSARGRALQVSPGRSGRSWAAG
jgi:MFS family permease